MATFACRVQFLDDRDPFTNTNFFEPTRPPIYSFLENVPLINQITSIHRLLHAPHRVEDCALQIYRYQSGTQGDLGTYLDLESSLDEQAEELEGFLEQKKNAIILRTQLTVRVHAIAEKLLNSTGRELRRALFSLKQIFQDDKDLVHDFVNNDGLNCLINVGSVSDQNYQNYILRALGQVMLYVDGMEGVIQHNSAIQWLYSLLGSKARLVVKTSLKLLLVFVEYTESNTIQLLRAINTVDSRRGLHPWTNVMSLLSEKDGADADLLLYTMTLINKVISAVPDQDMFYDLTDALEELEMDSISKWHMNKQGANLDLLTQFQLYESSLMHEDGEDSSVISQVENLRQVPRKKSESHARKSKRHEGIMDLTITEHPPAQPPGHGLAPVAPRRRKQEQRQSSPAMLTADENEQVFLRNHLPTQEKLSASSQQDTNSSIAENSRTRRRNRQRSFIDDKQELASVMDKHERQKQELSAAATVDSHMNSHQAFSTPFYQANVPPSYASVSSVGSRSEHVDGRFVTQPEHLSRSSSDHDKVQSDVPRYSSNSSNEHSYQTGRSPESIQEASYFNPQQKVSDSSQPTSPVSFLSSPTHSQPSISRRSINLPVLKFDNPADENKSSITILGDRTHFNNQRPHHPHFHNHYRQNSQENFFIDHQDFPKILSKENSFETFNNTQSDKRNDSAPTYNNQIQEQTYSTDTFKSFQSQETMENSSRGAGDGQVKNMLNKLKNEQVEDPREATRPVGDFTGIILNARDNLSRLNASKQVPVLGVSEEFDKKGESDFQWDRIQRHLKRQLKVKDMDFSDLVDEDDVNIFSSSVFFDGSVSPSPSGIPPPPPPVADFLPPPPPLSNLSPLAPSSGSFPYPSSSSSLPPPLGANLKKNKKTLRLHWRPLSGDNPHPATKEVIWKHLVPIKIDTEKLEHLFETKTSDHKAKKQDGSLKKEITILDPKRSNAINIGLTVLPPPRSIKAAILRMDNSIMNKEGIEKILTTMIPTEEEKAKILEAQMANPDTPLGSAEQFLLTLSSIFELQARLKLWLFKLDYESSEQELAEPLMDLKSGIAELRRNKTFRCILSGVLTIGNFLNGAAAHAFNVEFLQRLSDIKDTVRKHSLIHHLCTLIIEQFPETTDLYSEIGPITRCSRVDWEELANKLNKMENDCKSSWDYLQAIVKHDGSSTDLKGKMSYFLSDAAERIMILRTVFQRIMNRYKKMLLFLGFPIADAREMKVNHFCKVISEFALEYRTTRDKVIQMKQKKANQRERKKTRGKMIVDTVNFRSKDKVPDDALNAVLKNGYSTAEEMGLPGHRSRRKLETRSMGSVGALATDSDMGEDEILEACFRTATTTNLRTQRERKRSRHQRKSLRRTLKGGLAVEEVQVIEAHTDHV